MKKNHFLRESRALPDCVIADKFNTRAIEQIFERLVHLVAARISGCLRIISKAQWSQFQGC